MTTVSSKGRETEGLGRRGDERANVILRFLRCKYQFQLCTIYLLFTEFTVQGVQVGGHLIQLLNQLFCIICFDE